MRFKLILLTFILSACAGNSYVYKHITPADSIKLCFIGDTGTGNPVQKSVSALLEQEKCNSIHFVGDLIYPSGIKSAKDKQFFERFYDHYYHLTEKDNRPRLYLILGNHDHRGSVVAWEEIAKKYTNIIFPAPWYLVKINDLCLAHLDTDYYKLFFKIPVGYNQKSWMKAVEQKEMKDCAKKIALTHHPYISRGPNHGPSKGLLRSFQDKFIIGKFDYLISGHEHILSDEGTKKGTRLLISGAGGNPEKGEEAGFLVLIWNNQTKDLKYEFRKLTK